MEVELALQWSDAFSESIRCYTNIIRNKDGGTHMSGLRTALTSSVNSYAKKKKLLKGDALSGDDVREGLGDGSQCEASRSVILVSDKG